jgi:hypothetical protein
MAASGSDSCWVGVRQHNSVYALLRVFALSTGVKRLGCGCNPGHAGVTGSIPTTVENCGLYIVGRLSVTSAQVASRQGGGGLGGLPLFMCPRVIIIQACVSRPQTAPPSQGAGPMGGILWRYGAKGGPYGLLLLLYCLVLGKGQQICLCEVGVVLLVYKHACTYPCCVFVWYVLA